VKSKDKHYQKKVGFGFKKPGRFWGHSVDLYSCHAVLDDLDAISSAVEIRLSRVFPMASLGFIGDCLIHYFKARDLQIKSYVGKFILFNWRKRDPSLYEDLKVLLLKSKKKPMPPLDYLSLGLPSNWLSRPKKFLVNFYNGVFCNLEYRRMLVVRKTVAD